MAIRIEVAKTPEIYGLTGARTVPAKILDSNDTPVTWIEKVKGYYHTIIVVCSGILLVLSQLLSMKGVIPEDIARYTDLGIVILTPILTLLKSNEQWIDSL